MYQELERKVYRLGKEQYGASMPKLITYRLNRELQYISQHNLAADFLLVSGISDALRAGGVPFLLHGSTGNFLAAYLLGITAINSLPPHYKCPDCHHMEFTDADTDGFDLPPKRCQSCGALMVSDGHRQSCGRFTTDKFLAPYALREIGTTRRGIAIIDQTLSAQGPVTPVAFSNGGLVGWALVPLGRFVPEQIVRVCFPGPGHRIEPGISIDAAKSVPYLLAFEHTALKRLEFLLQRTGLSRSQVPTNDPAIYEAFRTAALQLSVKQRTLLYETGLLPDELSPIRQALWTGSVGTPWSFSKLVSLHMADFKLMFADLPSATVCSMQDAAKDLPEDRAAETVMAACQLAWFSLHYPKAYQDALSIDV